MKKHYILLCGIFATFTAFSQFTPPDDATQAVTVDASTLEIVNPERESYINTNFMLLSPGTGISGTAFNGVTAQTWAINTDWLVQNYHQYLTRGTGLTGNNYNGQAGTTWAIDTTWLVANYHQILVPEFGLKFEIGTSYNGQMARYMQIDTDWMDTNYAQPLTASTGLTLNTGTTYNGKAARTMTVDRAYIEQVIRETAFVVDNYQIYIDTTPSINPYSYVTTQTRTLAIQAPYYLRRTSNPTLTPSTANTTNVLRNSTATVPADWSTVSVVNVPNTTYTISSPTETRTAATNSAGATYTTSYSYYDSRTSFTFWTDAEFKVLDSDGNLIYWVSTQYGAQMGGGYTSHPATDLNAKIYYTCAEYEQSGVGWGRKWIQYVYNSTNARTIYEHAQRMTGSLTPTIGGIIIQPNLQGNTVGGTAIKSIFGTVQGNTPNNYSYVYLKCSPTNYERSPNYPNNAIWRPYNALSTAIQKSR